MMTYVKINLKVVRLGKQKSECVRDRMRGWGCCSWFSWSVMNILPWEVGLQKLMNTAHLGAL